MCLQYEGTNFVSFRVWRKNQCASSALPQGLEDRQVRCLTDFHSNFRQTDSPCLVPSKERNRPYFYENVEIISLEKAR